MNLEETFELDPLKTSFRIVGRENELKEIFYRIISGGMLLIEGEEGVGKTRLLKYAIDNFKGKGKVVYVNAEKLNKRLDIAELIRKRPKGMILLLDNVHYLSNKNNEKIKYFYDEDRLKSVIFTTIDYSKVSFTQAIKERIGRNIIKLENLSEEEILEIINERMEDNEMLPNEVIIEVYKNSKSIKEVLTKCYLLCRDALDNGREVVSKDEVKNESLPEERSEYPELYKCNECKENLININDKWRCPNCDWYCESCGALIDFDDIDCPECSKSIKGI